MHASTLQGVLEHLRKLTDPSRVRELSDADLLERFRLRREEAAFTLLVQRHGPMVLCCCRRILGDVPEVEDAFQAVFLVLSRKAAALKQPEALVGWLHGVARRVALKARTKAAAHPRQTPLPEELPDTRSDPLARLTARELLTVLNEEVARLPRAQRSAVVLCCLEGRTQEEAARQLGWTAGSLKGHLERGRRRLQERLRRRDIALSALAILEVSRGEAATALLLRSTVTAALGGGIGKSAAALAHSVLKAMFLPKLAAAMAMVLSVALAASTTVAPVYRAPMTETPEDKKPALPATANQVESRKPRPRTDAFGDPLPDGAVRRLGTLRFRHGGGNICNLVLTPDGKTLVSNTYYGSRTVCVWELATGPLPVEIPGLNITQQQCRAINNSPQVQTIEQILIVDQYNNLLSVQTPASPIVLDSGEQITTFITTNN